MNFPACIITAALLIDFGLHRVAETLELKTLDGEIPGEFQKLLDAGRYRRVADYQWAKARLRWIENTVQLLALLAFWTSGGFVCLEAGVQAIPLGVVARGSIYIGILLALKAAIALPFSLLRVFGVEARFGFNRSTLRIFFMDRIKAGGLGLLLGGPVLALILALFAFAGPWAWWGAWLAVMGCMLILDFVGPAWIMPLFNRFAPLGQGPLRQAILSYAASIEFPLKNVFVMDGSRRTSKANAFFSGFGKHRRIVLFDTLVAQHDVREVVAVLGHEMGHWKKRHIFYQFAAAGVQAGIFFYLLSLVKDWPVLYAAFRMETTPVYAGLVFFAISYAPLATLGDVCRMALARQNEKAADAFVLKTNADGLALIDVLKKLAVNHLTNLNPHPLFVWLYHSHPPIAERIEAIRAAAVKIA